MCIDKMPILKIFILYQFLFIATLTIKESHIKSINYNFLVFKIIA